MTITPDTPARDLLPALESVLRALRDGDGFLRRAGIQGLEQVCRKIRHWVEP